jgi:hypothetical protein
MLLNKTPVVQSVLLRRDKFTQSEAIQWILDHNYKFKKLDITPEYFRFRQHDPSPLKKASFHPRSISLGGGATHTGDARSRRDTSKGMLIIFYP